MFKLSLIPVDHVKLGNYFYVGDGNEDWQWHKIIKVNHEKGKIGIVWVWGEFSEKLSNPLAYTIENFLDEVKKGHNTMASPEDSRIPETLKLAVCLE